jgi:hypothetical protein
MDAHAAFGSARRAVPVVLLLGTFLFPWAATASPEEEAAPPPLAPEEAEPVDVVAWLGLLRSQLEHYLEPPERRGQDRALYDAWQSILKPRAARMVGRVKRLLDDRRWTKAEGDGAPAHLEAGAWSDAIRELASLYVELSGALAQYGNVRVTFNAPPRYGPDPIFLQPPGTTVVVHRNLWDLERIAADLLLRWRRGDLVWRDEVWRYWALARYAAFELDRYERAAARYEQERESLEDLQQRIEAGLRLAREMLRVQMFSVRSLTAALQAEEEARLWTRVEALPEDAAERARAAELAEGLWQARMEAQERLDTPAAYGSILRGDWLRLRGALVLLLGKAERQAEGVGAPAPR